VIFIDQMKKIHIEGELTWSTPPSGTPRCSGKDYAIGLNTTGVGVDDPDVNLVENYTCKSDRNYTSYCNEEVDKLIFAQSREVDPEKRRQIVWEAERKIAADVARPIILHNRAATCWQPYVRASPATTTRSTTAGAWRMPGSISRVLATAAGFAASARRPRRSSSRRGRHDRDEAPDASGRVLARHGQSLRGLADGGRGRQPLQLADRGGRCARIAERGKFDLFFISDSLASSLDDHPSFQTRFEPTTTVAALSISTRRVGLGATVSTSFSEPFAVARTFQSLQHLSHGRVAWNVVTSSSDKAALNFSMERHYEHDKRYEIASEFVDVVRGLWNTWDDGAVVKCKQTGVYVDPAKVRRLDHKGRYFQVRGPLNIERSVYGDPLIIQAGGSAPGQELSARTADIVFSVVNGDTTEAKAAYDSLKSRLAKHGRAPGDMTILPA
jgi:alkanesulfonate monooxygenase SsuD/methylene tetrahydromethanopterin reductase-like flavin-dependent oxidoreductase (luciferase family)